jgi:hypothetical protein
MAITKDQRAALRRVPFAFAGLNPISWHFRMPLFDLYFAGSTAAKSEGAHVNIETRVSRCNHRGAPAVFPIVSASGAGAKIS